MLKTTVTRDWPMGYWGVWCIFGDWKYTYQTIPEALQDPDVEIIGIFTDENSAQDNRKRGLYNSFALEASWSVEEIASKVRSSLQDPHRPFLGSAGFSDIELNLAHQLSLILADPSLSHHLTSRRIDKAHFYQLLQKASLPTVRFDTWSEDDELLALIQSSRYQQGNYILKPTNALGSAGVYRSAYDENAQTSIRRYRDLFEDAHRLGLNLTPLHEQSSLIMEYIDYAGTPVEISAEGIVENGKVTLHVVHEKLGTVAFAPFVDRRMVAPPLSPLISHRLSEIEETTQGVVTALGFPYCVFHIEYRLTEEHCIPIDCSVRPGGGLIPHAVYQLTGVDICLAHLESYFLAPKARCREVFLSGGTCIGAVYASSALNGEELGDQVREIEQDNDVFAVRGNQSIVLNPICTTEAMLALGVCSTSPHAALARFEQLIKAQVKAL